jgi:hypothetical protein
MSISWDYTCNVVVISREQATSEVTFKTNQVSDYDGQQRIQADYKIEPVKCTDCWRKVGGVGGIEPVSTFQKGDMEANCGDACVFYSIEEYVVDDKVVLPRKLVGRSFRTGRLLANITDSLQIQTMTFVPDFKAFLGIGRCCQQSWCDTACKGIPDQDLVIFQFVPKTQSLVIKAHLGPETGDDSGSAIRLGVEVNAPYDPTTAFVMYDAKIVSYDLRSFARKDAPAKFSSFIGAWAQN